ncbi:calcium-binding protein [Rhodobacter lacus]|uniref:Uncharacterized protein n=1 Tax=Rhodobacter lacus TaxID=1641972 RepID=A0ABW5ABB0_9RHOB
MTYHLVPAAGSTHAHDDSTGNQYHSSITPLADGGALVVFEQRLANAVSGYDREVTAQRYDASGNAVGGQIVIEHVEGVAYISNYYHPVATGLAGGGYAIAWEDPDTLDYRVQTFTAAGGLLNDVTVELPDRYLESRNEYVSVHASAGSAALTALEGGGFALSLDGTYAGMLAQYVGASTIYTQTFSATGIAASPIAQVTPWVGSISYGWDLVSSTSDIAALDNGTYIVVMRGGEGAPGNVSEDPAVMGQIYSASGTAIGSAFMISQATDTWAEGGSIAVLENGDFVVAWRGEESGYWRRFAADGTPLTDAMELGSYYVDIRATATSDGGFLITAMYSGYNPAYTTYGYRFDADNALVDGRFVLTQSHVPDDDTTYYNVPPEFALLGNGQYLALIEGNDSWNGDGPEVLTWRLMEDQLGTTGADALTAAAAGAAMFGREGNDTLTGSAGTDYLDGGAGNDSLSGGAGDDTLVGGSGDTLDGGAGSDTVIFDGDFSQSLLSAVSADTLVYNGTTLRGVETVLFYYNSYSSHTYTWEALADYVIGDAPVSTLPATLTHAEGTIALDLADYFSDADGDSLSYTVTGLAAGLSLSGSVISGTVAAVAGGAPMSVTVTASDGILTTSDSVTWTITNVNAAPTGAVTLAGTAQVGAVLTASSSVADADGINAPTLGWQWLRDGTVISGATAASYTLTAADQGHVIAARLSYTDLFGTHESVTSAVSATVAAAGPVDLTLEGTAGADTLSGAEGDDLLSGDDGNDSLSGGAGDDGLRGGAGNDTVDGGPGDDNISGAEGADSLSGGDGDDLMGGGLDNDSMDGGTGNDFMGGGMGDDTLLGSAGNDTVNGGAGDDSMGGGIGNDVMGASFGNDTLLGGDGNDAMGGGSGRDSLSGDANNDTIGGGEGDDTIRGGAGDDFLAGGGRHDRIFGDAGDDMINGGEGNDTMTGGTGADVFLFNAGTEDNVDILTDFSRGEDLIRLVGVEKAPGGSGLQAYFDALDPETVTYEGATAVQLSYDGQTILVLGLSSLGKEDFIFL